MVSAGCASFNSGDISASKSELRRMLSGHGVKPAAEIRVVWHNFPYKNTIDTIGEGRIQPEAPKPVPAPIDDLAWLKNHAKEIFSRAGLYDAEKGSGTINIALTSYGRWTYGEIFRSFLVDTGWIFIIPATLRVEHRLTARYDMPDGEVMIDETGQNKTTFHALLFPLYPFVTPGAKEHSLLKDMLWKSAADAYSKLKRAAAQPAPLSKPAEPVPSND